MTYLHLMIPREEFPPCIEQYAINFAYSPNQHHPTKPLLRELFSNDDMVQHLAHFLKELPQNHSVQIPIVKPIICRDVLNPKLIPSLHVDKNYSIFENNSLLCAIRETHDCIELYIFKK